MVCVLIIAAPFVYIFIEWGGFISEKGAKREFETKEVLKNLIVPAHLTEIQLGGLPPDCYDLTDRFGELWLGLFVIGFFLFFLLAKTDIISKNFIFIISWFIVDYFLTHLYLIALPLGYYQMAFYSGRWTQSIYHIFASIPSVFGIRYITKKRVTNFTFVVTKEFFSKSTIS